MLKIHQLFFYKTNKSWTVFLKELFQILPLFMTRGKKSHPLVMLSALLA